MSAKETVFVVDDDVEMRRSLRRLLESVKLRVQEYSSAQEFLDAFESSTSGCLVLDVRMPGMSGIDLQRKLDAEGMTIPIIFITSHGDVRMAVEALKRGAADFVVKPFRAEVLLDRIQQVLAWHAERSQVEAERQAVAARLALLTPREREVVDLVFTGMTNKRIAAQLGVSSQAIDAHRAKAMDKLQADSIAALVRIVLSAEVGQTEAGARRLKRRNVAESSSAQQAVPD